MLTLISYYAIGVPLACYLGLKTHMGVVGLQVGIGVAIALQCFSYMLILRLSDW